MSDVCLQSNLGYLLRLNKSRSTNKNSMMKGVVFVAVDYQARW